MASTKPYLIRAIHEWCSEEGFTPYLAVSVDASTRVPRDTAVEQAQTYDPAAAKRYDSSIDALIKGTTDGLQIVLNVGLEATHQLQLGNDEISFQARFGGRAFPVVVPVARVSAIYARENGEGMAFEVAEASAEPDNAPAESSAPDSEASSAPKPSGRPALTRVK